MSPRAASRLESLGFREVYDYAVGKADWFAAGLPMEGEAASRPVIGRMARSDVPSAGLDERLGDVTKRVAAAGWDQAVVLDDRRVLLGWLGAEALDCDPAAPAAAAMREGPVTFRPNMGIEETASWMDARSADSVLVTSSDGTFMGVVRHEHLGATERAGVRSRSEQRVTVSRRVAEHVLDAAAEFRADLHIVPWAPLGRFRATPSGG